MEVELWEAQSVSLERNATTKFLDVLARQHGSATSSAIRIYQFDGERYRLTKCQNSEYLAPDDPERSLEKPLITDVKCDQ
jgi:hypothetical protein